MEDPHAPTFWQRAYLALRAFNNLLLIPMFTLMILETSTGDLTSVVESELVNTGFCAFFLLEWMLGLVLAERRLAYLKDPMNLFDLLSAIPFGYVFQSARLARLVRVFRLLRVFLRAKRFRGRGAQFFRAAGVLGSTALAGALAFRTVEPETTRSMGDALWWAIATVSTVGYGDIVPASGGGRIVGTVLVVCGIGVFGYVAGVTTALLQDSDEDETLQRLRRIEEKLEALVVTRSAHGQTDDRLIGP